MLRAWWLYREDFLGCEEGAAVVVGTQDGWGREGCDGLAAGDETNAAGLDGASAMECAISNDEVRKQNKLVGNVLLCAVRLDHHSRESSWQKLTMPSKAFVHL